MTVQLPISHQSLAQLMPMHVWLDSDGCIRKVGPSFQKLFPQDDVTGQRFIDLFDIRRPRAVQTVKAMLGAENGQLQLSLAKPPHIALKGVAVPVHDDGGALINLSFGIAAAEAVAEFGLTLGDFAATDLTVELLYLIEAKTAVLDELRKLNTRLQGARIAAEEQAFTDTLTGLKNRRALEHVTSRLAEGEQEFGLMHLDLDYFKTVNDTYGHAAGDHVLQQVARILVEETRVNDTVVRVGGDEFVLIFEGPIDMTRLERVANRIIERLEEPISYDGAQCRVSASIGTTMSSFYQSPDWETMQHDADMALYASKRAGRSRVTLAAVPDANYASVPRTI